MEMSINYELLGSLLKQYRESSEYKQKEVSDKLEVTAQTISAWENGKNRIDIDSLFYLCDLYGADATELLEKVKVKSEEKPAPNEGDGLTARKQELMKFFETLDEDTLDVLYDAALLILRRRESDNP